MADAADPSRPEAEHTAPEPPSGERPARGYAARRAQVESGLRAGRRRLEHARSTSRGVAFVFEALGHDKEAGGTVLAAALGFRAFLFQIPYICFLVFVAGYVADAFGKEPQDLFHARGIGGLTAQGMTNADKLSGGTRFTALVVSAYAMFLAARAFVKVIAVVHTLVWRKPPAKLLRPTRAALGLIVILTAAVALSLGIGALRDRFLLGNLVALVLYTFVPFFLWLFVSWWLPRRACQIWALVPGAALFAAGAQALHVVTVVWLPHQMESKSEVYGAFGMALALLVWAYLLGRLMTVAATLNFALWTRREHDSPGASLRTLRLPLVNDSIGLVVERLFPPTNDAPSTEAGPRDAA